MNKKIITFGCRLNACESELIQDFTDELNLSNFTLINTCAVTAEAERKLRQTIRKIHHKDSEAKIILTGCASELNPDFYIKMDGVAGIISNKLKLSKSEYLKYSSQNTFECKKVNAYKDFNKKIRGFLKIQNGCNHQCTYCIVRKTRGLNISVNEQEIVNQAKDLLNKGYKEIALTGVNISSYGSDLTPKRNLAYIVQYILRNVPEIKRLRLSSLDPADIDDELINTIANEERLLPHIHESIQSGDNTILRRMMRRHSREQVIEINQRILQKRPEVIFGADIIVGFPTETEEMFLNTKSFIYEANLSLLHIFPFSRRPGTPASLMSSIEKKILINRAQELKLLSKEILFNKLSEYIGKNVIILAEDAKNAKTDSFLKVKSKNKMITGKRYIFRCESVDEGHIVGTPIYEEI